MAAQELNQRHIHKIAFGSTMAFAMTGHYYLWVQREKLITDLLILFWAWNYQVKTVGSTRTAGNKLGVILSKKKSIIQIETTYAVNVVC